MDWKNQVVLVTGGTGSFGGKIFLKFVFWLEKVFPKFFAENGQYPLIVIKK